MKAANDLTAEGWTDEITMTAPRLISLIANNREEIRSVRGHVCARRQTKDCNATTRQRTHPGRCANKYDHYARRGSENTTPTYPGSVDSHKPQPFSVGKLPQFNTPAFEPSTYTNGDVPVGRLAPIHATVRFSAVPQDTRKRSDPAKIMSTFDSIPATTTADTKTEGQVYRVLDGHFRKTHDMQLPRIV